MGVWGFWAVCAPRGPHSHVVFPDIRMTHLAWRLVSRASNGRTRTATLTLAPAMAASPGDGQTG